VGLTTIFENVVAYYMLEQPSQILYATATEDLAKKWGNEKITEVLASLNALDKLTASTTSAKGRRTGNTPDRKEFIGGVLDIVSSQSVIARRQLDKRCLFIDEVDGVEAITSTGEGKWLPILIAHTNSYGVTKKIAIFGSPAEWETSLTREYYEEGECRHFFVPCPYCGESIELRLDIDSSAAFGLKAETKAGRIEDAYYLCEKCGEPIRNHHKLNMYSEHPAAAKRPGKEIEKYHWRPTKEAKEPAWRSYYLNALYSPLGMLTFADIAKERARAEAGEPVDMRSYVNIYCGLPYKDAGSRPRLAKVMGHRGNYPRGTVPEGVLFLTIAVDVQRGSARDAKNPARLEAEIMGTGFAYRTWSIDYWVIEGAVDNAYAGAWEELFRRYEEIRGAFCDAGGMPYNIRMAGIDSGDAADGRSEVVYRFAERWGQFAYPLKGFGKMKPRRHEKPDADIPGAGAFKKHRVARIGSGGEYVLEISTAYYKTVLFGSLNIEADKDNPSPKGYCAFPYDYPEEYFRQLTNTERRSDNSFHDIGAHEALDCRIYNLALSSAWLEQQVLQLRALIRAKGGSEWDEAQVNSLTILESLRAEQTACREHNKPAGAAAADAAGT
jgi:phage terminase large subunit GpA-like protein